MIKSTALKYDNRIFSNVSKAVSEICQNVTRPYGETTPTNFPYVEIMLLSAPDFATDLENHDTGANVSYQVRISAIGPNKYTETKEITDLVYLAFKRMGFIQVELRNIENVNDPNVFSIVGRYRRYIGSGDVIEKF